VVVEAGGVEVEGVVTEDVLVVPTDLVVLVEGVVVDDAVVDEPVMVVVLDGGISSVVEVIKLVVVVESTGQCLSGFTSSEQWG
jgi:hypothetical protein